MSNKNTNMEGYWVNQSDHFLHSDSKGLGAVLYSGMPMWFNKFYDQYQTQAFEALTQGLSLKGKRVLDVGCGVGRWSFRLKRLGAQVTGIDFERDRLRQAESNPNAKGIKFVQMSATKMNFGDQSFDLCNSITVLQHIPYGEKEKAIAEMCRVTAKGGYLTVIELIDAFDDAAHVFPWPIERWVAEFEKHGCRLVKTIGNEYAPLPRLLRRIKFMLTHKKTISREGGRINLSKPESAVLRLIILMSYPIEWVCVRILPPNLARHGGFLFEKVR
jgi:ubiquinone/menaquinone biosynthesis C-methylase UbiE